MSTEESQVVTAPTKMPRIVIIESTALFDLGFLFEHVDFADLLYLRKLIKFDIAVSRVSWLEFLRQRKPQILKCIEKVSQLRSSLEKVGLNADELKTTEGRAIDLEKDFKAVLEKRLSDLGINVLPVAKRDVEELLEMAINNVPPFEESNEKGFRDSLIMFSILETIKGKPEMNALIVSADKLFKEGILGRQKEYATSFTVVDDLGEAVKRIVALADDALRYRRRIEKQEARELLLRYRSELEKAVEAIKEVPVFEISPLKSGGHVERIEAIKFNDVNSATWKNRDEKAATILFSLKCTLTVVVSPPFWEFLNRRYQVGGGSTLLTPGNLEPKESRIEKTVFGVAEFIEKDGNLGLKRVQIESLSTEDSVQLTAD